MKSLQNTKYSIDEKLEKSFISLFGSKPNISSKTNVHEAVDNINKEELDQYEASESDEGTDAEDLDSSSSLEKVHAAKKVATVASTNDPGEENGDASELHNFEEKIEFHGGRLRRKANFGDDIHDDDLKVFFPCCMSWLLNISV